MKIYTWIAGNDEFKTMVAKNLGLSREYQFSITGTSPDLVEPTTDTLVIFVQHGASIPNLETKARELLEKRSDLKIIAVSSGKENIHGVEVMIQNGIPGYLTMDAAIDEFEHCVRKVLDDGIYLCTGFVLRMIKHSQTRNPRINLTRAEKEVLELIAEGHSNKQIADRLFVSVRTVESRRKKLLDKTGCANTASLVRFALLNTLIK